MSRRLFFILTVIALTFSACGQTGDKNTDPEAAQSFFPQVTGYRTYETENVQQALTSALGSTSALTGNLVGTALIERVDSLLSCYRSVGAVDAKIYVENLSNVTTARLPIAGALVVINQNRIQSNFLSCLTADPLEGVFGAQSANPEPCSSSGSFKFNNDTIAFAYVASDRPLCDTFAAHFRTYGVSTGR